MNKQSNHEKKGGYGKHNPTNQNYEKEGCLFPNHSWLLQPHHCHPQRSSYHLLPPLPLHILAAAINITKTTSALPPQPPPIYRHPIPVSNITTTYLTNTIVNTNTTVLPCHSNSPNLKYSSKFSCDIF
jgi:hypothetical protein